MNDRIDIEHIMARLEKDLDRLTPDVPQAPTKGFWVVDTLGRIIPANASNPELDWIADVQTAPKGARNIPVLCAASVMFDALKAVKADPRRKHLSAQTLELVDDALAAAE
jgi:hypothetical protein